MYFTKSDFEQIQAWLKAHSLHDSELPVCEALTGEELVVILQGGRNVLTTVNELVNLASGKLSAIPAPVISYNRETGKIEIRSNIATKIYYSINSVVVDSEYTDAFVPTNGAVIRAQAYYENGETQLYSEITTYTYTTTVSTLQSGTYYWGYVDASVLDSLSASNFVSASDGSDNTDHTQSFDLSANNGIFYILYPSDKNVSATIYDSSIGGIDSVDWVEKSLDDDWKVKYFIVDSDKLQVKNILFIS